MGASILPVTIHQGRLYFLFGKERDIDETPGWSDFGGGTDKGETFLTTASREGGEELTGFLGTKPDIRRLLKRFGTYNIDYQSPGHSVYRCHVFPLRYDPALPVYYNNNQRFLQQALHPSIIRDTKVFEKTQIRWFSCEDMRRQKHTFRSFYRNIVNLLLQQEKQIRRFAQRALCGKGNSNTRKGKKGKKNSTRRRKSPRAN
jgi:hypothetical protein